jgi:hypothetical protein
MSPFGSHQTNPTLTADPAADLTSPNRVQGAA